MDPQEIIGYTIEGIKWLGLGIGGAPIAFGIVASIKDVLFSEKIKSQKNLERIAEEEMNKLGMDQSFEVEWGDFFSDYVKKDQDGKYKICIRKSFTASRNLVRHELYHIHRGHMHKKDNIFIRLLKYYFIHEPQAVAYGSFGLKF
ncbi:hypothetical protein HYT24_00970 [Candidatus Pacearchaeota archaeon]|nr:hypothetical protein [Candidatus Pacearchaeota archaeon]